MASFGDYEREMIAERVKAGIARAQARGVRWGGRKVGQRTTLTKTKLKAVKKLLQDGDIKKTEIARQLGISRRSVYRAIDLLH